MSHVWVTWVHASLRFEKPQIYTKAQRDKSTYAMHRDGSLRSLAQVEAQTCIIYSPYLQL